MKKLILLSQISLFYVVALAQGGSVTVSSPSQAPAAPQRLVSYLNVPEEEKTESIQSKFINQQWSTGTVIFKNTKQKVGLLLIFDIYNNKPYFLKDGLIMEFTAPIQEFTMGLVIKNDSTSVTFRQSYPAIDKNTEETFYEVLVDGEFQLLKCRSKTIYLHKEKIPEEERATPKELLYAYLPNKKMVLIKKDKDQILSQLPEYATTIQEIVNTNRMKLKNEAALVKLFTHLSHTQ